MNKGKVVLITGGAKRIGASFCKRFHQEGWCVVVHYNTSQNEAERLSREMNNDRPDTARIIQGNLSGLDNCASVASQSLAAFGRVDVLVNNASIFHPDEKLAQDERAWQETFLVNALAPYQLSTMLREELASNSGCIINLLDVRTTTQNPYPGWDIYYASKAALQSLTISTAKTFAPDVRVNAISPGITLPPPGVEVLDPAMRGRTLLNKLATPADIADAAYWLASAGHVTGQTLTIDGGESHRW